MSGWQGWFFKDSLDSSYSSSVFLRSGPEQWVALKHLCALVALGVHVKMQIPGPRTEAFSSSRPEICQIFNISNHFSGGMARGPHLGNHWSRSKTHTISGLECFLKLDHWPRDSVRKHFDISAGGKWRGFGKCSWQCSKHNKNTSVYTFLSSGTNKRKHFQTNSQHASNYIF